MKIFQKIWIVLLTINTLLAVGKKPCIDPFSTINWGYFFDDLLIGSYGDGGSPFCMCFKTQDNIPDAGIKLRITEPIAFIELVDEPFKFPCFMGDSAQGNKTTIKRRGTPYSFRNAHYYQYPVFTLLNIGLDQLCVNQDQPLDIPFISELEPQWNDETISAMIHPENFLYNNPIAAVACLYDCVTSSNGKPTEFLGWCHGCWQSKMASTGQKLGQNPVEEDASLAMTVLDWMHLMNVEGLGLPQTIDPHQTPPPDAGIKYASNNDLACGNVINYFPRIIKNQYALQLVYPVVDDKIITLGENAMFWSNFKMVPTYQDTIFVVWRRKVCCMGVAHLNY